MAQDERVTGDLTNSAPGSRVTGLYAQTAPELVRGYAGGSVRGVPGLADALPLPEPSFVALVLGGSAPLSVSFLNSTTPAAASYLWDFGDGLISQDFNPTHVYASAGSYTVALTATNATGQKSVSRVGYINVTPSTAPVATVFAVAGNTSGSAGVPTVFTVTPNGPMGADVVVSIAATNGAVVSPSSLTFVAGATAAQTFSITMAADGSSTISIGNNGGLTVTPPQIVYTIYTGLTATFAGPSTVELYKPQTYTISLNAPAPGSYTITIKKNGVAIYEAGLKTGAYQTNCKDITFTSAATETLTLEVKRASTTATHPLPAIVGSPITVVKAPATKLNLLYSQGGKVGEWIPFWVEPNGPVAAAITAQLVAVNGAAQTSVSPASVTFAAGDIGRKLFWVYRHSAGESTVRLYNNSFYPTVTSKTLTFGNGSWADRSTRSTVLFGHNFADEWEVAQFRTTVASSPYQIANAPRRVAVDIGYALAANTLGAVLIEDVPASQAWFYNQSNPSVARQVWKLNDLSGWPDGPYPYPVYVGAGDTKEQIAIESINFGTNEATVLRRVTGNSYSYLGVSYPSGSDTAAPFKGDGTVTIGDDAQGAWERPLSALRIQGIRDDVGIANGSARKVRDWPPFNAYGARITAPNDRPHFFLQGYWGHESYWDPAQGAAEYKDWLPPAANPNNAYVRTDAFEGNGVWIQFRSRLSSSRIRTAGTPTKHFFIQNPVSGSGQFYWTAGVASPPRGDGRGNLLTPITSFGSDNAAIEPYVLTAPPSGDQFSEPKFRQIQHQENFPNTNTNNPNPAEWRFPEDAWVTYLIHLKFGRDNAPQPFVSTNNARAQQPYNEPATYDEKYRTTVKVFVAEAGDTTWKRITDYPNFAWVFGDTKYVFGGYDYNPPGTMQLQIGAFGNLYLGSGSVAPPTTVTGVEFTEFVVSRDPIPLPDVGTMPSDYVPDALPAPPETPSLPTPPSTGHYADGMQAFDVRPLSGTYAPVGGSATLQSIEAPPWNASSSYFGIRGMTEAWSGGDSDYARKRTYFSGGGHSDGRSNGIYYFDWSGTDKPAGFKLLDGSRVSVANTPLDWTTNAIYYSDIAQGPGATHTYSTIPYNPVKDEIYYGWYWACRFKLNPDAISGVWSKWFGDIPDTYGNGIYDSSNPAQSGVKPAWSGRYGVAIVSPDGSQVFHCHAGNGARRVFVDTTTGVVTDVGASPLAGSTSQDAVFCYNPVRDKYFIVGSYTNASGWLSSNFELTINWSAKTASFSAISNSTHPYLLCGGMGIVYDELLNCFWCVGGKLDANALGSISSIVRVDPVTYNAVSYPLNGSIPCDCKGQYRRIYWMSDKRVIGLITSYKQPAVLIKVPNS